MSSGASQLSAVVSAVTLAAALAGCAGRGSGSDLAGSPPPTSPSMPSTTGSPRAAVVEQPCRVRVRERTVPLSLPQARALTEVAVRAQRGSWTAGRAAGEYGRALATSSPAPEVTGADLVSPLSGSVPAALSCQIARTDQRDQKEGPSGLTARAEQLRQRVYTAFGRLPMGGFAAGGVSTGHVDDSSHYDGRALDIFVRPINAANTARGWVLAHWLVAHGDQNALLSVIFSDRIWTSWASCAGWRDYEHPGGPTRDPVLRHLDHVHTAVQGARPQRTLSPEEQRERLQRRPACARATETATP